MSSRRSESGYLLGCLVVPNFGAARDRHLLLGAEGAAAAGGPPDQGGSAVVVLATDAPLSERQLRRLGVRAGLGLGRAGSFATNGSGEYAFAFSTAHRIPHRTDDPWLELRLLRDDSIAMRELFEMAAESTHEAVLDSLCTATGVEGRDGHRADALPYELIERVPRVERL
jgi:D-aminopeptidase